MIVRDAVAADIPALTALWKTAFPDTDAYIDAFYRAYTPGEGVRVPVAVIDGVPVCAVHCLPCVYRRREEKRHAVYLYAVCAHPDVRGTGVMRDLLKNVIGDCVSRDKLVFLCPANDRLARYYQDYGFTTCFYRRVWQGVPPVCDGALTVTFADATTYTRIRTRSLAVCQTDSGYIDWNGRAVAYAVSENRDCGGKTFVVRRGASGPVCGGVMVSMSDAGTTVSEVLPLNGASTCDLIAAVGSFMRVRSLTVILPDVPSERFFADNTRMSIGMAYAPGAAIPPDGYIGLLLS